MSRARRRARARSLADAAERRRPVLRARELRVSGDAPALSFDLHAGEILGCFGLVGAGRTELLETLFGLRRAAGGSLAIAAGSAAESERPFAPRSAGDAIAAGLALVPEDRKRQGLVAEMSVGDNLTLAALARRPLLAWRDRGAERRHAAALCESLDVRPPRPEIQVRRLSGGNQQKVVLGKWLAPAPAHPPARRAHAGRRRRRARRDPSPPAPARVERCGDPAVERRERGDPRARGSRARAPRAAPSPARSRAPSEPSRTSCVSPREGQQIAGTPDPRRSSAP